LQVKNTPRFDWSSRPVQAAAGDQEAACPQRLKRRGSSLEAGTGRLRSIVLILSLPTMDVPIGLGIPKAPYKHGKAT
jgi:hypothetical protein